MNVRELKSLIEDISSKVEIDPKIVSKVIHSAMRRSAEFNQVIRVSQRVVVQQVSKQLVDFVEHETKVERRHVVLILTLALADKRFKRRSKRQGQFLRAAGLSDSRKKAGSVRHRRVTGATMRKKGGEDDDPGPFITSGKVKYGFKK